MSQHAVVHRVTAPSIHARKNGEPIVCLTAYTTPMAALLDEHCDLLLVGDSVGMVVHGLPNTVGVTMDMMIMHGQAVMRGSHKALVVVDMPFGSYEGPAEFAFANAVKLLKETGDKLPAEQKGKIEAALAEAKKDLESDNGDRMKAALENLQKVGAELYAQAQQSAGPQPGGEAAAGGAGKASNESSGPKKADVVDADFEVVDDENNKK